MSVLGWLHGVLERRRMRRLVPWSSVSWSPAKHRAKMAEQALREHGRMMAELYAKQAMAQYQAWLAQCERDVERARVAAARASAQLDEQRRQHDGRAE